MINQVVAGWINYYGRFYKSLLIAFLARQLNPHLIKWHPGSSNTCTGRQ